MNRSLKFLLAIFLLSPLPAGAYQILFYCNSSDGISGVVKRCVPILEKAGHQVTVIDMKGKNHDPAGDNWGPPFDQVWDMRFLDRDSDICGSGRPHAADYFDEAWRQKAISFLGHCGKLFIAGEHYQYADRDEGIYRFLQEVGAVKGGYDPCPPSESGNSTTNGDAFYPVRHGLGPVSFFGAYVGGIPLAYLNGTSFVQTDEDWESDEVDRSVVSGWTGDQLKRLTSPACDGGKLFMVWDATMWSYWDKGTNDEIQDGPPIWSDSSWEPGQINPDRREISRRARAREVTTRFFPAVAHWLGSGVCPCGSPVTEPVELTSTPSPVPLTAKAQPASSSTLRVPPLPVLPRLSMAAAQTILFNAPPVNIEMQFKDGAGRYRLDIYDSRGFHLNNPYNQTITLEKEAWAAWDGTNEQGALESFGQYYAYLSKDGRFLRKIALNWIRP